MTVGRLNLAQAARELAADGGALYRRGHCAACDAPIPAASLYCDADCRAEHEHQLAVMARQQRGGAAC